MTTTNNTTTRTLESGKMQFNVKSAKNFRDTLAKWHNADFELAVALDKKSKTIASKHNSIKDCEESISKIENGTMLASMKTIEDYKHDIECYLADIENESKTVKELREVQKTRLESAYALLSKELHSAYVDYIKNGMRENYVNALCTFFETNGLMPTLDSINDFVSCVGKKKATTRNKIANAKHNDAFAYNPWRDIFLGELCDVMGESLPIDKFIYKTMEERVQVWEESKAKKSN